MTDERALSDEERDELHEAADAALERLEPAEEFEQLVASLAAAVDALRDDSPGSRRDEQAFQLGAAWAAALEQALGWETVHVTWDEAAFEAVAVVDPDRSLALVPLHHVQAIVEDPARANDLPSTFSRLRAGERPKGLQPRGYALLL